LIVGSPARRCGGPGSIGFSRKSEPGPDAMCGRRSRGRPPEFLDIEARLLAVASDLFYRFGVRAVSVDEIVKGRL
jgi:hypothetical protein